MGGKNPFMGIAYVVVGGICIVLGTLFTVAHLVKPRYVAGRNFTTNFCGVKQNVHRCIGNSATTRIDRKSVV